MHLLYAYLKYISSLAWKLITYNIFFQTDKCFIIITSFLKDVFQNDFTRILPKYALFISYTIQKRLNKKSIEFIGPGKGCGCQVISTNESSPNVLLCAVRRTSYYNTCTNNALTCYTVTWDCWTGNLHYEKLPNIVTLCNTLLQIPIGYSPLLLWGGEGGRIFT